MNTRISEGTASSQRICKEVAEAGHSSAPCEITPTRLRWLKHLAKNGESRWGSMPKRENALSAVTNRTWRPMVEAGLITARFGQRHYSEPTDWLFTITDAGRAAIAKATQ